MESIKNIQAFLAIVNTGSFTAAANKLFITQPTITKRVAQLESSSNNKLFHRKGATAQLTSAGKTLLPYAIDLMNAFNRLEGKIQDFQNEVVGELTVACSYQVGLVFLPQILKHYANKYPKVDIKFDYTSSLVAIGKVDSLETEIALITINDDMPKSIGYYVFEEKQFVAVIARDHNYWQQSGSMLERLNNIPILSPCAGNKHHAALSSLIHKYRLSSPMLSNINMLEMIKRLVEAGFGWSIVTKDMVSDKLKELPLTMDELYISNACIYNKNSEFSRPAKAFLDVCKEYTLVDKVTL
ncbi:LysR family transcriptional regulator [Francisella sp. 19X1-34]|uniref:LysR family transcriptional regulator n=1 Tax=Francisella sp. 19X1-34 TaxID=3087177 RepID=UPI002E31C855|nr:LysR family transcriptional regulator [Francisella sp. 19X1-34]MED7788433.1 LysR family transcriptional regulator [Francisella sp. 19X1-34]